MVGITSTRQFRNAFVCFRVGHLSFFISSAATCLGGLMIFLIRFRLLYIGCSMVFFLPKTSERHSHLSGDVTLRLVSVLVRRRRFEFNLVTQIVTENGMSKPAHEITERPHPQMLAGWARTSIAIESIVWSSGVWSPFFLLLSSVSMSLYACTTASPHRWHVGRLRGTTMMLPT